MSYRLDNGPAQVGISGGRSSAYMGEHILKAHDGKLPPDVYFNFNNTGKERPETIAFLIGLRERWGVPLPCIEFDAEYGKGLSWKVVDLEQADMTGGPFDKMLRYYDQFRAEEKSEAPILPNPVNRMCTDRMKIKASAWWMRSMGYDCWDAVIGIRHDEPIRAARMMASNGKERWENVLPMYEAGVTKADVNAYWAAQDIDLGMDSDFGNCDLCFLKHENKIIRVLRRNPAAADWWIAHEERTGQRFRKDRPSYRELQFVAGEMNKQMRLPAIPPSPEEEDIEDCICG